MTLALLLKCEDTEVAEWCAALTRLLPDQEVRLFPELGNRADIEYALVYAPPPGLLASLPNLKTIFSLWAGIDHLKSDPELPPVPVVRMVERGMTLGMAQHVALQALAASRNLLVYLRQQRAEVWHQCPYRAPWDWRVGIMGLGALGLAAAHKLRGLDFQVAGWSRSPKDGIDFPCYHGTRQRDEFLAATDILVCLLPLTDVTKGILNGELFARLPRGAVVINCARGGHLVEADLLEALDSGQLGGAALDVFEEEPLPKGHPFWAHPKIVVTPHVAALTGPETAVESIAENIRRLEKGEPPHNEVDFGRGY
jgi:glyoxylate/hydroxypyruvate reductase A